MFKDSTNGRIRYKLTGWRTGETRAKGLKKAGKGINPAMDHRPNGDVYVEKRDNGKTVSNTSPFRRPEYNDVNRQPQQHHTSDAVYSISATGDRSMKFNSTTRNQEVRDIFGEPATSREGDSRKAFRENFCRKIAAPLVNSLLLYST